MDHRQILALETRGDNGDLYFVAHGLIHNHAEVDLDILVLASLANQGASLIDFVEAAGCEDPVIFTNIIS